MSVVVSANYRDRSQKNFLVRQEEDSLDKYELRDRVVIKDFKICAAVSGETGFGCSRVVVGELVEDESSINGECLIPVGFFIATFFEKESEKEVVEGSVLVLDKTGKYYIPTTQAPVELSLAYEQQA